MNENTPYPRECLDKIINEHYVYVLYFAVDSCEGEIKYNVPKEIFSSFSCANHRLNQIKLMKKLNYEISDIKLIKVYLSPKHGKDKIYHIYDLGFITNDINIMKNFECVLIYVNNFDIEINEQLNECALKYPKYSNELLSNCVDNNPIDLLSLCAAKSLNLIPYKYIRNNIKRIYAIVQNRTSTLGKSEMCEIFSDKKIAKNRIKELSFRFNERRKFYCLRYYFSMDTNINILYNQSFLLTNDKNLSYVSREISLSYKTSNKCELKLNKYCFIFTN